MTVDLAEEMRSLIRRIMEHRFGEVEDVKAADAVVDECLESLTDLTEEIALADVFLKVGGLVLLRDLLADFSGRDVSPNVGSLLATVVQNNEEGQSTALNNALMDLSLKQMAVATSTSNADLLRGLLSGISGNCLLIILHKSLMKRYVQFIGPAVLKRVEVAISLN